MLHRLIKTLLFVLLISAAGYAADRDKDLRKAAEKGDLTKIHQLLSKEADVNAKDDKGVTALMLAAGKGHAEVVQALLDAGAEVEAKDNTGLTAAMRAERSGYADIVKLLNRPRSSTTETEQLRAEAAKGNVSRLQELLKAGADVNAKDPSGVTALMEAVHAGKVEAVKFLISRGADVNATADRERTQITPLSVASENIQFVSWVQEGLMLNLIRKKKRQTNNQNANDIARALLAAGASVDKSPSFLDPDYLELAPKSVAIVQLIDARSEKADEEKMRDKMAKGFAAALRTRRYEPVKFEVARQKLANSGLTGAKLDEPDIKDACAALSTDAIARMRLHDYRTSEKVIAKGALADADFEIVSCATNKPLWKRATGQVRMQGGFIVARFKGWDTQLLAEYAMKNLPPKPKGR